MKHSPPLLHNHEVTIILIATSTIVQEGPLLLLHNYLESKLCSTPVTTVSIVLDCIICSETNPLWQWAILPLLLGKRTLGAESLL